MLVGLGIFLWGLAAWLDERANQRFQAALRMGQRLDWSGVTFNGVWLDQLVVSGAEGELILLSSKDEDFSFYVDRKRIGPKGLV